MATIDDDKVIRAVHLLLAQIHLDAAGIRPLAAEERQLVEDLSDWYDARRALENNPTKGRT